jgi:hypothetical protein
MFFQIKEIILWPKNKSFAPRRLKLELGKVNIISGASRTGKSAIIPIIDYCLGSENCSIPVKTIRDACDWFGILVSTSDGEILFARKEPGSQKSTGDMFILEGISIEIPNQIQDKNATVKLVKQHLDQLAGLTNLDFDLEDVSSGFLSRPSFRDFGAFVFQPQNIIANPDVLFYKADTYEHREKLKTIFPYVLQAITPELLALQHELSQLKKELRRKQNEFETVRQVSDKWLSEIKAQVSQAKELGLIDRTISLAESKESLVRVLSSIILAGNKPIQITEETISNAIEELNQLKKEEAEISIQLSIFRKRFSEMSELKENVIRYRGALSIQRDRLKISEWLQSIYDENHECPICGQSMGNVSDHLSHLVKSLNDIEQSAGGFNAIPPAFDREMERVRSDIRIYTEKLNGIRLRREALERSSSEIQKRQYDTLMVERFIGNLEKSLEIYQQIGTDSELNTEVSELKKKVESLEEQINQNQIKIKTDRALATVNANAEKLLPFLDVERPDDPISLKINDLTIKVKSVEREDYLWEIGSGSNWLSYHIAVILGLQTLFLSFENNPVPNFIILDQPSQVYFPRKMAIKDSEIEVDYSATLKDEDIIAVHKVFETLSKVVNSSDGRLQILVLDHASENTWGDVEGINLVEEWRDGKKLVPLSWL